MLRLKYHPRGACAQDWKVLEMLDLLPGLRDVRIHLWDVLADEWEAFLAEASERLAFVKKVMLEINISRRASTIIYERQWLAF
jgi:hypothetical protein